MGAFTDYLIATYGIEDYLNVYRKENIPFAIEETYGKSLVQLNREFAEYVKLFPVDAGLKNRMDQLFH